MSTQPPTLASIRLAAMNLLAMREHSAGELKKKLTQKFELEGLVEEAVNRLTEQGLQSDERFTKAFVGMRQRQGKGSVLIKLELREKKVVEALIDEYINESDPIWRRLAQQVYRKRFGLIDNFDAKGKAKQMRFLQSRGFAVKHLQSVFQTTSDDDTE